MSRAYRLLCGNFACETRLERQPGGEIGHLFAVDENDLPDGEIWLCPDCRAAQAAAS
jgi:hypothetical protein